MFEQNDRAMVASSTTNPPLWSWPTYISIGTTLLVLLSLLSMLDWRQTWHQVAASNMAYVVLGSLAHYATYVVRGCRWHCCLAHVPGHAGWGRCAWLVFFANFVDNIVPAKLADVYAAHLAWINCGVRRSVAMGSIVFIRTVDAWVVLLLAGLVSWALFAAVLPRAVLWSLLLGALLACGVTGIILLCVLSKTAVPRWLPAQAQYRLQALHLGMWPSPSQLGPIALLTIIIWALETLWTVALVSAFDVNVRPLEAIFLTTIPLLASAFPLTPSGAGVVELTLFGCLRLLGVAPVLAVSVTVVNRLIDYWLHIGLGVMTWACRHLIGLRTWREMPLEESRA